MRLALVVSCMVATVASAAPNKHEHGTLVILIDRSGSMQGNRLDAAKAAMNAAASALDPTDDIEIVAFDSDAMVFVRLEPAAKVDKRNIDRLQAGGGTDYLPALELAHQSLAKLKGKKHVVLLSDGEAPADGLVERIHQMRESGITLSAIGIGDADRELLKTLADAGDGRVYMADDLSVLTKLFVQEALTALPR